MSTRSAGSSGALLAALSLAGALACSGQGPGASDCRAIERARCDRQATCEDWSDEERDDCRAVRASECHAGATPAVRDATDAEIDACVAALAEAPCDALAEPFALPACAPLAPDAGP